MHPLRLPLWRLVLSLALVGNAPAVARAKKTVLHLGIATGDTLRYRMDLEQEVNFQGMSISLTEGGQVEIVALESHEDTLKCSIRFSAFEGSMRRGEDLAPRTPEVNGVALRAVVLSRGEVVHVQPLSAVRPSVLERVKMWVDLFFADLPTEPVEPDDSWTRARHIPNETDPSEPPNLDGTSQSTLDELTKKDGVEAAKILSKGKTKLHLDTEAGLITGETKDESETFVSVQDGRILQLEARSNFSGMLGAMEGNRGETLRLKLLP